MKDRLSQQSLIANIEKAERAVKVSLSPDVRAGFAAEYAAAEYDVRRSDVSLVALESQESAILTKYLFVAATASDEDLGFNFKTTRSGTELRVLSSAKYGRLRITLNPPVDTFTVIIDDEAYDSASNIMLLTGIYDVIVDRTTEQCKGKVRIQERRTSKFACR